MRKLMTTTALVAVLAVPGFAVSGQAFAATAATSAKNGSIVTVTTVGKADTSGYLASDLIGRKVYESSAKDAKSIGDIEDVVLSQGGKAEAVIIGVGGFLGVGEKDVAIEYSRLKMQAGEDGELRLVSEVSKAELEAAASYERNSVGAKVSSGMASAGAAVSSAGTAVSNTVSDTAKTVQDKTAQMTNSVNDSKSFLASKTKVAIDSVKQDDLIGATVYDRNGQDVGEVSKLVVKNDGKADAAIIDVGGFLGIGEKPVALDYRSLEVYQDQAGKLYVSTPYSEKQLEAAMAFDADVYKTDRNKVLLVPN